MYIEKCYLSPIGTRDWIIKGEIAIKGEFTAQEWDSLKELFISIGLFQMSKGLPRPSELVPTRQECVDALMADARNEDASNKLREKYHIPPHFKLPSDLQQLLLMNSKRWHDEHNKKLQERLNDQSKKQD